MGKPLDIVDRVLKGASPRTLEKLPSSASLADNVYSLQAKNQTKIRMTSLQNINTADLLKIVTELHEPFLKFDTGYHNGQRALVFSTMTRLAQLSGCDLICCDGTFDVSLKYKIAHNNKIC